ncbi:MAG: glycosyltransferase family 4 protein [Actinomycetota bacterium]|nr:glycosyltransferase family 4 protein [Actinomycetota bacterium]
MRLLLITNDYPPKPGGIQQYLGNIIDAYRDEFHVIAPADKDAEPDERISRNDSTFMWPTPKLADWVEERAVAFAPDAILFGAPHPLPFLGPRLRERLGVPYGVLSHGAEVTLPAAAPGARQTVAKALRDADVRFAVSRFTADRVQRLTGKDVVFVGAGVDIETFTPAPTGENEIPVIGCVSRFVPRKGQHRLIEAAARLDRPVELLLVGKGRKETQLRKLADRLGVRARFAVDVPWSDLPGLYREMDVFCMPCKSRWGGLEVEGLGLVFLEAAATGLPVLAGDSGGSPETVIPAETGYVVHSVDDIVEGLSMVLDDPAEGRRMGLAGRCFVEDVFTWPKVVERFREGFES